VRAVAVTNGGALADAGAYQGAAALATKTDSVVCISARARDVDEHLRGAMSRDGVGAVCAFPLTVRGKPAGALCVLRQGLTMGAQERQLIASFARQAAVGIENVILFGERQQRLEDLADLSLASARISSTLDLIKIAQIIVESIAHALHTPVAAIALLDSAGEFYLPEGGHRGLPASFVRRFAVRPDSIAFSVVADQRIKVISDIAAEGRAEDCLVRGLNLASLICAPLKSRQGVLGVLFAADRVPRTLHMHEEALISAYANEAALALQNAFHHQAVATHARELEGILDATKTISSTLELQPVLDHLASAAASLLEVPVCNIMLLDQAGEVLHTAATCGLPAEHELHSDLRVGESIAGTVGMQGVAMASTDLPRDGRFKHRSVARAEGLRSMLSVPLTVQGKPAGVITVYSRAAQPFTESQERLLTTLAAEAAVAIENARLYNAAREQARSTREIMEEVNHRVKNNLQSIIGIIQLHIAQADEDPNVTTALREVMGRVQAIAVVHELLFDEDMRAVDVKETTRRILDNALRSAPDGKLKLAGQVTGARLRLPSRKATPLASVVNELVYNSVSHAFSGRARGSVAVSFQEATGGQILVQVSDDGVGLPAGFDLARDAKLGLRIVEGLVTQDLGGEFSLSSNGGTIARIRFER
jgi:two-component sensor histidine kinase